MIVDGGLVQKSFKFPKRLGNPDAWAIKGVWSGGTWLPNTHFTLQHYRDQRFMRFWQVVGVDLLTRPTFDTLLLVEVDTPNPDLDQDDILVFGPGTFTIFNVKSTDLPLERTSALQVGSVRYHGIAKVDEQARVTQLIVFHPSKMILLAHEVHVVWWNNQEFHVDISPKDSPTIPMPMIRPYPQFQPIAEDLAVL